MTPKESRRPLPGRQLPARLKERAKLGLALVAALALLLQTPAAALDDEPSAGDDQIAAATAQPSADSPSADSAESPADGSEDDESAIGQDESDAEVEPSVEPETVEDEPPVAPAAEDADAELAPQQMPQQMPQPFMSVTAALPATTQLQNFLGIATANTNPAINTQSNNYLGRNTVPRNVTGAAPTFTGIDWSGNLASTKTTGASWSSDVTHVYADRGYVSRAANPNNNVSSSTRYYPNGSTTGSTFSTAANRGYVQDVAAMNTLQAELDGMRTALCGVPAEATGVLPSGAIQSSRTINVDQYDTNGDGIAIIAVGSSGTDSELDGINLIIEGSGNVLPIFRIADGIHFKVNNSSVLLGATLGAAMSTRAAPNSGAPDQAGAIFLKCNSGGKNFDFSNAYVNGIAFWDLTGSNSLTMQLSNVTGCGQFVGPVQEWANVELTRCAVGIAEPTGEPEPPVCEADLIYVQGNSGRLSTIDTSNSNTWAAISPTAEAYYSTTAVTPSSYTKNGMNGLAVGEDGTLYGFARATNGQSQSNARMWVQLAKTDASGVWSAAPIPIQTGSPNPSGGGNWFSVGREFPVAGGIDHSNGRYLFGGWGYYNSASNVMTIYEYDGSTITALGKVTAANANTTNAAGAGDLVLDDDGNLYIVRGDGTGSAGRITVTTVTHAALEAARANPGINNTISSVTSAAVANTNAGNVGGLALMMDGAFAMATGDRVWKVDPVTFADLGDLGTGSLGGSNTIADLASCRTATTLSVEKDLPDGRAINTDQFTLQLRSTADAVVTFATTTGTATGVQAEKVLPTPIRAGGSYRIAEVASGTTNFSNYTVSYSCTVEGATTPFATGTTTASGNITIPASAAGGHVTCTFTNTLRLAAPCTPETVYLQSYDGRVASIPSTGTNNPLTSVSSATSVYNAMTVPSGYEKTGVNGLGIRPADGKMFGFARIRATDTPVANGAHWLRLMETNAGGTWQASPVTSSWYRLTNGDQPIAGAVDPATGHYFFGGWGDELRTTAAQSNRMTIYEYDGTSITALGRITVTGTGILSTGTAAGDIAFDPSGNLYALRGDNGAYTVTTVTRASLDEARANPNITSSIPSQSSVQVTVSDEAVGGIAVLQDGSLAVANQYKVWTIDPVTMTVINSSLRNGNFGGDPNLGDNDDRIQDLASCASSTTVTVQKDLPDGRARGGDQFTLAVTDGQGAVFLENTTTGSSDGVQPVKAGPVLVRVGSAYGVAETAAGTTVLSDYISTLACVVDGGGAVMVTPGANGTSGTFTIPSSAAGKNVTCTFRNTPKPARLTLVKAIPDGMGDADPTLWTLTASGGDPAETHSGVTGAIAVTGVTVQAGEPYTLGEAGGPATYVQVGEWACVLEGTDTEVPVTVNSDSTSVTVAAAQHVVCTVTNGTARISLLKQVLGDPISGIGPEDWQLTATPETLTGLVPQTVSGAGASSSANTFDVRPGHGYSIAEALTDPGMPLAYRLARVEVSTDGGTTWTPVADPSSIIAPGAGQTAIYRFVNERINQIPLPLTGGTASDYYRIAGGLVLLLALGAAAWTWRRRVMT